MSTNAGSWYGRKQVSSPYQKWCIQHTSNRNWDRCDMVSVRSGWCITHTLIEQTSLTQTAHNNNSTYCNTVIKFFAICSFVVTNSLQIHQWGGKEQSQRDATGGHSWHRIGQDARKSKGSWEWGWRQLSWQQRKLSTSPCGGSSKTPGGLWQYTKA